MMQTAYTEPTCTHMHKQISQPRTAAVTTLLHCKTPKSHKTSSLFLGSNWITHTSCPRLSPKAHPRLKYKTSLIKTSWSSSNTFASTAPQTTHYNQSIAKSQPAQLWTDNMNTNSHNAFQSMHFIAALKSESTATHCHSMPMLCKKRKLTQA